MAAVNLLAWAFDILLGLGLLWVAWRALASADLFQGIVLFVVFGLLMAFAWVRLGAPDIALAEAAIGAGLTGALLMAALARLRASAVEGESMRHLASKGADAASVPWLPIVILLAMTAGLGHAILSLPPDAEGLGAAVAAKLGISGVGNPVTAVLLNFRGYDTLLELVVLFVALLGVWSLGPEPEQPTSAPGPVLDTLARALAPVLILVAAYLLWVGAHAPGGAFQAGSVLGAAGVLLLLAGWRPRAACAPRPVRLALVAGPVTFVAVAVVTLLTGARLLELPPKHAGTLILILEAMATLSIGLTLAALFLGRRPRHDREHR